jgi:hypothetical protein
MIALLAISAEQGAFQARFVQWLTGTSLARLGRKERNHELRSSRL